MKVLIQDIFSALFMGILLPLFLLGGAVKLQEQQPEPPAVSTEASEPQVPAITIGRRLASSDVVTENLENYLVGVVLAEMPGSFEKDALKAQAVAARTYTLKASVTGGKHGDGSLCTESSCCQAYISPEDYLKLGGTQELLDKITSAVQQTHSQVLLYEDELIDATYFSCSGGTTEEAAAVWGGDVPYLVSVSSPGEETADHYSDTKRFTADEILEALGIEPEGTPEDWLGMTAYTKGGGVDFMIIGNRQFRGTELRSLLGLNSTAFAMEVHNGEIIITTKGHGHRVGMSQYGADAMAVNGSTYEEILAHYYPGTALTVWE